MILLNPSLLLPSPVQDRALPEGGWDGFKSSTAPLCAVGSDIVLMGHFAQSGLHFLCFLWAQVAARTTAALCPCYLCSASSLHSAVATSSLSAVCSQNWVTRCQPGLWHRAETRASFLACSLLMP